MSAAEITEEVVRALAARRHGAYVVNFANADMVGHTGKLPETIAAVETLDRCFGILEAACRDAGRRAGDDGGPRQRRADARPVDGPAAHRAHDQPRARSSSVPAAAASPSAGTLADVAPTLLAIQGIAAPPEMKGRDLRSPS